MTNQEIFNKVVIALRRQGKRSSISHGSNGCLYRLKLNDGRVLKCAVGHLIPDEDYSRRMEGRSVSMLAEEYPHLFEKLGISNNQTYFLHRLQSAHDGYAEDNWEEAWQNIAADYELEMPPMEASCEP